MPLAVALVSQLRGRSNRMTSLTVLLSKLSGTRYDQPSAQNTRRRIVDFFDRHLKP